MMSVDIKGLKELQAALNQLPREVQKRPLRAAVSAAAKVIQDEAKRRAPIDTGNLRKAIYRTRSRSGSGAGQETFLVAVKKGKAEYANTTRNRRLNRVGKKYQTQGEAYYWRFIEFGRPSQGVAAKPFLRPAFENKKQMAVDVLKQKLGDAITKTAMKLKK
jgi:HK97 gp10 family phage protein